MSEAVDRPPQRGLSVYLGGLACGALATLATPTALLAAALLLPTIFARLAERGRGRPLTRCMALFGLAGALPALAALWRGTGGLGTALTQATDIGVLARAGAAQAAAWLLAEGLPIAGKLAVDLTTAARERRLRAARARILQEWALDGETDPAAGEASGSTVRTP